MTDQDRIEDGVMAGWWLRQVAGYCWRWDLEPLNEGRFHGGAWLVRRPGQAIGYPMLRSPRMLDQFIEIGHCNEADRALSLIERFSARYGMLGREELLVGKSTDPSLGIQPEWGESLLLWVEQAQDIAALAQLGDAVARQDRGFLRSFVEWGDVISVCVLTRRGQADPAASRQFAIGAPGLRPGEYDTSTQRFDPEHDPNGVYAEWNRDDPVAPMNQFVHARINNALRHHIDRAVVPHISSEVRYFPDSLLTAMWVQLQNRLVRTRGREIECANPRCVQRTFVPSRRDKKFCSKSCRNAVDYAQRKSKEE